MRKCFNHPAAFAILGAQVFFFAASLLPIWKLTIQVPGGSMLRGVSLWSVLWETVMAPPPVDSAIPMVKSGDMRDILVAGAILGAGAVLGYCAYVLKVFAARS